MKTTKALFGILTITTVLAVQVQAQSFLTNGLVAYYPFNGNGNDASGYLNNPLLNNASLTTDRFNLASAAYSFSGSQQIEFASQPQLESTTDLTVLCWVKTTNTFNGFYGIVCKATGSNPWVGFQVGVFQNHIQIEVDLTSFAGSVPINDGKWHSICAVFDHANGLVRILVDGNLDTTYNTPQTTISTQFPLYIGTGRGGVSPFTGSLDDVRIYNRALSSNEVAQLYAIESAPPKFQLITGPFNTWTEAKADAESRGGHLATITCEQEWQQLTNLVGSAITNNFFWWMGATDVAQEGVWRWVTGELWSYTRWNAGEPSGNGVNGKEDYLVLSSQWTWHDAAHSIQFPLGYVLEFEPKGALVKAVKPTFTMLSLGANYQLQISTDLNTWTNYGETFTATNSIWRSTNYWDVDNWNQLFFRLQLAP